MYHQSATQPWVQQGAAGVGWQFEQQNCWPGVQAGVLPVSFNPCVPAAAAAQPAPGWATLLPPPAPSHSAAALLPPPPARPHLPVAGSAAVLNGVLAGGSRHNSPDLLQNGAPRSAATGQKAQAAVNACRALNNKIKRAASVEELFSALAEGWPHLDCINFSASFHRLSCLAEAAPSLATFRQTLHAPALNSTWCWLLDQLPGAAAAPEFGPQCMSNTLVSLCKLDALSPSLLQALHGPLLRALCSTAGGSGCGSRSAPTAPVAAAPAWLDSKGLSQVMWAFSRADTQQLMLALKQPLFQALWTTAPSLDAQALATTWWALGEMSSRCETEQLHVAAEAPDLLPRLAAAVRAAVNGLTFQGLSQVVHACTKMRPQLFRDEALLQTIAAATSRKLQDGQEAPTSQGCGLICLAFGRLGFLPRCHWCMDRGVFANLLDELGVALAGNLQQAKPQEVSNFVRGLGLLTYAPPAPVLNALLTHLGGQQATTPSANSGNDAGSGCGRAQDGSGGGQGSLVLEQYNSQDLTDLVCGLSRILTGAHGPVPYPDSLLPPGVLTAFFDSLDTVLRVRLAMAAGLGAHNLSAELALTGQHVGSLCHSLARLTSTPGAALTEETLAELESHVTQLSSSYGGSALVSLLEFYAVDGMQPGAAATAAVCERATAILQQQLQSQKAQVQHGFGLGGLAKMATCLAALDINCPSLLCALLPTAAAVLAWHERALQQQQQQRVSATLPAGLLRDVLAMAAALGQLQTRGLLAPAGLASPDALLPFWHLLMGWVQLAVDHMGQAGGSAAGVQAEDARLLQQAAGHLNSLAGGRDLFWLPQAVTRGLAAAEVLFQQPQP